MENKYIIVIQYLPGKNWIKVHAESEEEKISLIDISGPKPKARIVIESSKWRKVSWTADPPYTKENLKDQAQVATIMSFFEGFYNES